MNGKFVYKMKTHSPEEWKDTGIPKIAKEEIGLIWGGDFSYPGAYDPVHFELEPFQNARQYFKENAGQRQGNKPRDKNWNED